MKTNDRILAEIYGELRALAAAHIAREQPGQTLSATALVHEAYLRIGRGPSFETPGHFYAAAAESMRRILVDAARRRAAAERGGGLRREHRDLDSIAPPGGGDDELLALHAALERLEALDPAKAEVVKLRYFVGLNHDEIAGALNISSSTVDRHWAYSRAWLKRAMTRDETR